MDGLIEFQKECDKQDIKPILGCELYVVPSLSHKVKGEIRGHLTVLVQNLTGWHTLCRWLTVANLEGFYYRPRVDYDLILNSDLGGLVFLTGCAGSFLYNGYKDQLESGVEKFMSSFEEKAEPDQLYLEVMPHDIEAQHKYHNLILKKYPHLPLVASNDCHYILEEDWEAQEALLAIQTNAKWTDENRWTFGFKGLHLRTADEMILAFKSQGNLERKQIITAMANSVLIAERCCSFRIPKQDISLPEVPGIIPKKETKELITRCYNKLAELGLHDDERYTTRLKEELTLVKKKKFARYFLIVQDFVQQCQLRGWGIGNGRGSVGGSLIAHLLGITEGVDPIKYDLLFSRFISEHRIDYPDIDIDVEKRFRADAVQYLYDTYGINNVCGISTGMRMKSKAAIRDVGRIFQLPLKEVSAFAGAIWDGDQEGSAIEQAVRRTHEGKNFAQAYPKELALMIKLEGQLRQSGQHPAGIIISGEDLTKGTRCVLVNRSKKIVANWSMNDAEYCGLMKLDVLGLATISVLKETEQLINRRERTDFWYHPGSDCYFQSDNDGVEDKFANDICDEIDFDLTKIPHGDKKIFELITDGYTAGLFQISARPLTKLCTEMGINNFNDLVAANALVRPGPSESGMTEQYIARKHGGKRNYIHPIHDEITKDTYGMLVYQEQIVQIISRMAGMSESDADHVRKVIGKKRDPKEFKPYEKKFIAGCRKENTFNPQQAESFWSGLMDWANYGFNRCLSGNTLVEKISGCGKRYLTIKEVYSLFNDKIHYTDGSIYGRSRSAKAGNLRILQLNKKTNTFQYNPIKNVYYNGYQDVYKVITENGKVIIGTDNHRLMTNKGWQQIKELSCGDLLLIKSKKVKRKRKPNPLGLNMKNKTGSNSPLGIKGPKNIGFINGKYSYYKQAKIDVTKRSKNKCEQCGNKDALEFAHIKLLKDCNFDYKIYHSQENIQHLCKKHHRRFDFKKGEYKRPDQNYINNVVAHYNQIASITYHGKEDVFDIEMQGPDHNFVANNFISHNSHSVAYSLITYRTAWLKVYYPKEFLCATLTYGEYFEASRDEQKRKQYMIDEVSNYGLTIMPPKIGISQAINWVAVDNVLYAPFIELKGIGESNAEKCVESKERARSKLQGFFKLKTPMEQKKKTKIEQILTDVQAYTPEAIPSDKILKEYLPFSIVKKRSQRPVRARNRDMQPLLKDLKPKKISWYYKTPGECNKCSLRKEASGIVQSSPGRYNIAICAEAPGFEENQGKKTRTGNILREGLIGKAGQLLWSHLAEYKINRKLLHVANICKCFPSKTRTPKDEHIEACLPYLLEELKEIDCRLILACGNICLKALTGRTGGITKLSGQVEFVEKVNAWVVWCVHPSAVLRNREQNLKPFKAGISQFVVSMREFFN